MPGAVCRPGAQNARSRSGEDEFMSDIRPHRRDSSTESGDRLSVAAFVEETLNLSPNYVRATPPPNPD
jgi:hypothetical protein